MAPDGGHLQAAIDAKPVIGFDAIEQRLLQKIGDGGRGHHRAPPLAGGDETEQLPLNRKQAAAVERVGELRAR